MKMRHHLLVSPQDLEEFVIQITRFQTRQPDSEQPRTLAAKPLNQRPQWAHPLCLATAKGGGLPIRAQENPAQDDLAMPRIDQGLCFGNDIFHRLAPQPRAQIGNDAVGAMRIASILNLKESPLVRCLMLVKQWQSAGSNENPLFSCNFSVDEDRCVWFIRFSERGCWSPCLDHPSFIPHRLRRRFMTRNCPACVWFGRM